MNERIRRTYITNRRKNTELKRKELDFSINGRIQSTTLVYKRESSAS